MKKLAATLFVVGMSLSACASPSSPAATAESTSPSSTATGSPSPAAESTASQESAPEPSPSVKIYRLNEAADHDGLVIKVTSAKASPTLLMNTSDYRPDTDLATFEPVPAKAGAEYVILTTQVTNNTKKGLDLTCGGPVQIRVYNEQQQEYTPVDDLYQIKGNPECNASLDPGFSAPMTWAFQVPAKSSIIAASFYNINDFEAVNSEPTVIALDPNY